jgi:Periplasmic protease
MKLFNNNVIFKMKSIKNIIIASLVIFLLSACTSINGTEQVKKNKDICRISEEQKLYELSVVWKELSYNFANMNNCPGLDMDSLYRVYIPLIQNTQTDFEYYKMMLRFLANFNNGHTTIVDIPPYLDTYIARPYIKTAYENGKIIVENIGNQYADKIRIGDEITHINGVKALTYFEQELIPYICASNEKDKIHYAMFNIGPAHLLLKNTKLTLKIESQNGKKEVDIFADKEITSNNSPKDNWLIATSVDKNIQVIVDSINSFMYVHFFRCDESFYSFFKTNKDKINKYQNLIIDLSDNLGGMLYYDFPMHFLFEKDTILDIIVSTKTNRAACKARGEAVCNNAGFQNNITPYCHSCCDYYKGTFFEFMTMNNLPNSVTKLQRYKGNIYLVTNKNTASAAEGFAIAFSQNANVSIIGQKTAGAIGQPYRISLPSGFVIHINTDKTYDYHGNDISSGISPDYEYDFSDFYKTKDGGEMLNKFVKVIQKLEAKKANK